MKKLFTKENLTKFLIFFLLLQPFLDTYILFEEATVDKFGISPSTVIRLFLIFIMAIMSLFVIKSKKQWLCYIIYGIIVLIYSGLHIYYGLNSVSLDINNFNFSIFKELFYIIRLLIPIFIFILTYNIKYDKEKLKKAFNVLLLLFSGTIVLTNIFKISIASYITKPIEYNMFDWFIYNIHSTHSFYETASRGFFLFANTVSSILFGFTGVLYYNLFKEFNWKKVILLIIQIMAMFMLGTKVSTFGFLLSSIASIILYLYFVIIRKNIKFNYKPFTISLLLLTIWFLIYPYSPCKNRTNININMEEEDGENNEEIKDMSSYFEGKTEREKGTIVKEYVKNNYENFGLKEDYVIKKYPYEQDAYFWYTIFDEDYNTKNDNRILTSKIYDRLKYLNGNKLSDELFGISYTRASNINILERDFLSQYYYLGILGFILFIFPYLFIIIYSIIKVILDRRKFTYYNLTLILCSSSALIGAYYCGNSLDNLTFTIIYSFILGILFKNMIYKENNKLNENEITILALHLNYGGVEKYISSLCKMLEDDYKINIISTYKINDKPAFEFSDKINIKYLINYGPNKEEFKSSIKNKNIYKIIVEGCKSIKILYLKKYRNIKAIKKINSKYIITTRTFHNELVSKYANKDIIKIATEHNYHNDDNKYVNKLIKSLKKYDYFILVSNELKEYYENKVKAKCIYIPNVIDNLPKKYSNLSQNNLISIGRLEYEKGYDDLIDIIFNVKKEIKDIKLYLIGDGSLKQELQTKIDTLGLKDNIILTGFLSKEEIEQYFIKSKLFIMTSYTESFGLVLIEAMSYKVPCIAFDSASGARELLKNKNGILIENRNKEKMSKEIIKLLKDKDRLNELSINGYNECQKYLITNVKKEWLDLIKRSYNEE